MKHKTLYYTIYFEGANIDEIFFDQSGWKTIRVYKIQDNIPKLMAEIVSANHTATESEIQIWLDNNNIEDEFNFEEL